MVKRLVYHCPATLSGISYFNGLPIGTPSFAGEGHYHPSLPCLDIAFKVKDLLPCPQDELPSPKATRFEPS